MRLFYLKILNPSVYQKYFYAILYLVEFFMGTSVAIKLRKVYSIRLVGLKAHPTTISNFIV